MPQPDPDVWRQRFTARSVTFPTWSPQRPDRLYFLSDESGSTQGWVLDLASGRRSRLTDQVVGVESVVVTPDGSGAAWWSDDTGDENGAWVVSRADGSPATALLPALPPGWSQGLSMAAGVVAVGLADDRSYRIYVARRGRTPRLRVSGPGGYRPRVGADAGRPVAPTGGCSASGRASRATSCTSACASSTSRARRSSATCSIRG